MHLTTALLALAAAPLAAALPGSNTPKSVKPQDIINSLAGTYALVNTSSTQNNIPIPDAAYGTAPVGLLTYTRAGYMSATITATEPQLRPNLTFPFQPADAEADWALVGKHSIGYAGPFRVNTALPASKTEGQVFHGPLTVANVPTWVGTEQRRNYTVVVEGGETYLRIGSERGGGFRGVLWWRRIAGAV
ncbi:Lipocalin-like domain-containing protein [Boeremia exigua]|uniref:Lipocalin-like domain-containing protein n=1 Tax=Boeremia exigua TaxID=749465 RepID=UPI001E8E4C8C|nr:Lipocalin-like domain-containing protein [Boeremia exigua]KAH6643026.1 Lipocalin-like domain-containing protein [Boeremia exigua]